MRGMSPAGGGVRMYGSYARRSVFPDLIREPVRTGGIWWYGHAARPKRDYSLAVVRTGCSGHNTCSCFLFEPQKNADFNEREMIRGIQVHSLLVF